MAWESSEAAQCHGLWELPAASPDVILLCHALSLQQCGGTAIPGLTGSLVGLKEPFLYPPLVFLQHLPSVTGVHIDQVEGVTQKGILHLVVQLRIRVEAGRVVHLPRQAGNLTWYPWSQPTAPGTPHAAHGCSSLCQRQEATHSTSATSHLDPTPQGTGRGQLSQIQGAHRTRGLKAWETPCC